MSESIFRNSSQAFTGQWKRKKVGSDTARVVLDALRAGLLRDRGQQLTQRHTAALSPADSSAEVV